MKLDIPQTKDKMIMCRFLLDTFNRVEKLAKKHKTSRSKIIRALVDKALEYEKN